MKIASYILIISILFITACTRRNAQNAFGEIKICSNEDYKCNSSKKQIDKNENKIYAFVNLGSVISNDAIRVSWQYFNGDDYYEIFSQTQQYKMGEKHLQFTLEKPINGWPIGDYKAVFIVNADKLRLKICQFEIK